MAVFEAITEAHPRRVRRLGISIGKAKVGAARILANVRCLHQEWDEEFAPLSANAKATLAH